MSTTIAGVDIGAHEPCRFIAEISNNHNGSLVQALQLLDAAKEAGADFAKLQSYTPEELVALRGDGPAPEPWGAQGYSMHRLYEIAQTPHGWFPALFKHARSIDLPLFSSVFGLESLALCEWLGCPAYKIARLDNHHGWLYDACAATGKPVIVSANDEIVLGDLHLWCPPGYPQPALGLERDRFDEYDGFSYHGTDPLAGVMAAALGAQVVEAHLQLRDIPSVLEHNISLNEYGFASMVNRTRRIEAMRA